MTPAMALAGPVVRFRPGPNAVRRLRHIFDTLEGVLAAVEIDPTGTAVGASISLAPPSPRSVR
ncbi:MAG: hypothetical protein U0556_09245 [Dehalococcoidia bacterium]